MCRKSDAVSVLALISTGRGTDKKRLTTFSALRSTRPRLASKPLISTDSLAAEAPAPVRAGRGRRSESVFLIPTSDRIRSRTDSRDEKIAARERLRTNNWQEG